MFCFPLIAFNFQFVAGANVIINLEHPMSQKVAKEFMLFFKMLPNVL